ncbi:MAG: hypothetical protein GSR74_02095 [Desulfurococcales archaeon]|nr:hypothetical protein [Desulfurococcales archaeon]
MKRRTADDAWTGEEPSLTRTATPAVTGSIIMIDLDDFGEIVEEKGWSRYRPNQATGLLSSLIEAFARKWQAVIVYGLDWERGTEEAVLELPGVEAGELTGDLARIAAELCSSAGVSATIVAVTVPGLTGLATSERRPAYMGYRRRVKRILESLKRRGGGVVYVDGEVVFTSPCRRI